MSNKPFIGQRVDFYSPHLPARPLVATVADVTAQGVVNLAVILPSGEIAARQGVAYLYETDTHASFDFAYAVELGGLTGQPAAVKPPVLTDIVAQTGA